jgi:glycosyltransferase involved in cell wall biosynthesis
MKKKILFITKDNFLKKLLENNQNPGGRIESLLGYNKLDEEKYEKSFCNLPRGEVKGLAHRICHLLETPFRKVVRLGISLEVYPLFKKQLKEADIIFCVNDSIGLGLLFWKKLGFVKADVIVVMMALSEKIKNFRRVPLFTPFISALLKKAAFVTTLSDCASNVLRDYFKLEASRVRTFHYGVNTEYWRMRPEIAKENFILSVGNDGNRDFQTLINALPENIHLKIATKLPVATTNPNVEILNNISPDENLIKLYNQALFAVVPSVKLETESAGLSSDLQLMSSSVAVIISSAPCIKEMFTDGEDCLFYEAQNTDDLREKIKTLWDDKILRDKIAANGHKKTLENYTCQNMAEELEKMLNQLSQPRRNLSS